MLINHFFKRIAQLACTFAFVATFCTDVMAQPVKISGTLVNNGDVATEYAVSPDGRYAVYIADQDVVTRRELYSVNLSTGVVTKISGDSDTGRDVLDFVISPDSTIVVFRGDMDTDDRFELYSVAITGGVRRNRSRDSSLPADNDPNGDVLADYKITPDSNQVVFRGKLRESRSSVEIYRNGLGATNNRLVASGTIVAGGNASSFALSRDGLHVVFDGDLETDGRFELFRSPLSGLGVTKISGVIVAPEGDVIGYQISADSSRVVFRGDLVFDERFVLFSTPITGGTRVSLAGTDIPDEGDVLDFQIAPNSNTVVFRGDVATNDRVELFSVSINGGTRTILSGTIVPLAGGVADAFAISANSSRVVFRGNLSLFDKTELYSVPISGGARTTLSGTITPADGDVIDFQISADSGQVAFLGDLNANERFELFSAPITGGSRSTLSGTIAPTGGDVLSFQIDANSAHVVFIGDLLVDGVNELFSAPLPGGNRSHVSRGIAVNSVTTSFRFAPNDVSVLFRANDGAPDVNALYVADIVKPVVLDMDGDGNVFAHTDLLMLARYQLGFRGAPLTNNAIGTGATLKLPAVEARVRAVVKFAATLP